ncbi:FtsX-like permease family protein [Terriglobus albidus]|uniref:FtsX-like permease family protein n=1 Tax=Terriglobus albidus TaxID=1592106 RepID=UPI0021E0996F|nr:FtsX-like permease family protein [Terriglobus albidus]
MTEQNTDVIQGTLDLLILKTLSLEPMHGFGIARRVEQVSRGVFKVNPGSLLTALQRLERAGWLDAEWKNTENSRRSVAERIHEIGVRMALGATRNDILTMALGDGMRLTAFGIAIGVCGAFAAGRAIASLLFGTSALDPLSWLGMLAVLAFVAMLACWIPAWRGTRVDPARTLRSE